MGEVEEIKEEEIKPEPKDLQKILDAYLDSSKEMPTVIGVLFLKLQKVEERLEMYDGVFKSFSK